MDFLSKSIDRVPLFKGKQLRNLQYDTNRKEIHILEVALVILPQKWFDTTACKQTTTRS